MNLRDLEYLVALDEHRHFGRAAAACFVSQPTLSTQVRKLETELGVQLIERGARQVLFTTAGDEVVRRARHILSEAEDIRDISRQLNSPHTGTLRLGIFPTLGPYLLPHAVPKLGEVFPDLEVLLTEAKSLDLSDQLRAGTLDAAVLARPVHEEWLADAPLFREDFVLATPVGHELDKPVPLQATELQGQHLLLLDDGHCLRDQALEFCQGAGAGERDGFRATSLETLRHMVAAGVGITLLPELAVAPPVIDNPRLALRRFNDPAPHRDLALFWRKTSVYRDLMPQLADVLRESAGDVVRPLS
ncbi:MAG: LysR substrate-binding domain-containing protein [Propionibacteriaceae bacterium]|nr:LysR substrate-binding domain-containing protein [Propionibacteriaceae bacterium]